jgi:hypothetical protein
VSAVAYISALAAYSNAYKDNIASKSPLLSDQEEKAYIESARASKRSGDASMKLTATTEEGRAIVCDRRYPAIFPMNIVE